MDLWKALRSKPGARFGFGSPASGSKRAAAMQRIQWAIGIAVTAAVAFVWWNGFLDKYERDSIDARARTFASANAQPSDRIAVVAIDDAAIGNIGRWPWDREKLAAVIDELGNAGVTVIALDLLLDDPQQPRPIIEGDKVRFIHDDDILGAAIKRHGRVVSAVSFKFAKAESSSEIVQTPLSDLYTLIRDHPDLLGRPWDDIDRQVKGFLPAFKDNAATKGKEIERLRARWDAAVTLAAREADSSLPPGTSDTSWAVSTEPNVPIRAIAEASHRLANVTFDSYDPDGLTRNIPVVVQHNGRLWPTLGLAAAIEFHSITDKDITLSRDYLKLITPDGQTRELATFTRRSESAGEGGSFGGLHLVSWPRAQSGGDIPVRGWERQLYDDRATRPYLVKEGDSLASIAAKELGPEQRWVAFLREANAGIDTTSLQPGSTISIPGRPAEVPIGRVYEPVGLTAAVTGNWRDINNAVEKGYRKGVMDTQRARDWEAAWAIISGSTVDSPAWKDATARARTILRAAGSDAGTLIDMVDEAARKEMSQAERDTHDNMVDARKAIEESLRLSDEGIAAIAAVRHQLRQRLAGTICFVGWTATGSLADFVATSIDPRTPGVHVHAAVCNTVLTGFQRVHGPVFGQLLVIVALGLVGTWIGVRSSVVGGPLLVMGALALWATFACIVLWGMYDAVWSIAGPTAAAAAGWLVVVLHRLLVEQRSRRKTEERFKSYVSPAVVDILVENPSLSSMAPQQKELTVLFTDIAGFTTTAERLGSQGTAELLAVYLGTMTEIVQRHRATLDKYIGDAIMAFWGAPIDDALHARHACTAAVEMMNTLDKLNASNAFGAAGTLNVRIGLASGDLMVGDFGNPPRNSSYTVIGDTANLSSRLEGANKVFGTRTLVSDLTRGLAGEGFLWRRIGMIKVKGKQTGTWVHELLPNQVKGEKTAAWVALCDDLIADYQAERFEQALGKAVLLRTEYHDEGFASAYGEAIAARQAGLVEGEFDGCITLTDK